MKILITGAKGFVGRNLCAQLNNIKDGKARNYGVTVTEVYEYDLDSTSEELDRWCAEADFVFNLAGVNRPKDTSEFMSGNFGFASTLLDTLKKHNNTCPVMLSSSQQASLAGRFGNSEYGRSKKAGEELFLRYGEDTGARVLVYRFPNLFGKWCRPNYNSAVATFCNAVANDLPYTVNDPSVELELLYIDDLVDEMIACLRGEEHRCDFDGLGVFPMKNGPYCYVPTTHRATLGEIVDLLHKFEEQRKTLIVPEIPAGSFAKKLYSTFLSYLPKEKVAFPLKSNVDARDSFTELVKTLGIRHYVINIKDAVDGIVSSIPFELSTQSKTNLPPRIRMSTLYAVSQSHNGRVSNNCNLSEDWVGYSTRYGDSVGDFSPLSKLTVNEVKQIGRVLGLPSELVDKVPTDGLCGKTDEENLGFTYDELDRYIREGVIEDQEKKAKIDRLHAINQFKLELMPVFDPKL